MLSQQAASPAILGPQRQALEACEGQLSCIWLLGQSCCGADEHRSRNARLRAQQQVLQLARSQCQEISHGRSLGAYMCSLTPLAFRARKT